MTWKHRTVRLPVPVDAALALEARRQETTPSAIIRKALVAYVGSAAVEAQEPPPPTDEEWIEILSRYDDVDLVEALGA
jgi:hypothetical protein